MIPLDCPNMGELEKQYVLRALDQGYISNYGPLASEFERKFANYIGAKHAVAVINGTAGLYLALKVLGIGEGDEVIIPDLTFAATANAVVQAGAIPVAIDVNLYTWTVKSKEIINAITRRTKAIIPVHLYGNPADMNAIMEIAGYHKLFVIEDACESLGSMYKSRHTGTIGDAGVFSFNGNKIITAGGGGMLIADNDELAEKVRILANQGRQSGLDEHEMAGYNYRLSSLQAALGMAQLERLPEFLKKKREINHIYRNELRESIFQESFSGCESNWWITCIRLKDSHEKRRIMNAFSENNVQIRPIFKPLTCQKWFSNKKYNTNARFVYETGLCLPSSTVLKEDQVKEVCRIIKETLS